MTPLNPGDLLDHYRIDRLIARGGMASVFRATDLRTGLTVAIKVPHPEAECDALSYDRFQREERIGRTIDFPGVIREISDGKKSRVYMVLQWVEGQTLREVLARENLLPVDRAVAIACRICEALEYIHGHGVIHRDLKPENVFLLSRDEIKLFDFGVAAMRGARRLTFGGFSNLTGTADYIAPEQIQGNRGDARTDLYALGVMLYEMLIGKTPFEGENVLAVMNRRLYEDAVPPREFNPDISEQLEAIVSKAMARNPRDRYGSASELAWDLEHPGESGVTKPARQPGRVADRVRAGWWSQASLQRQILMYVALAMIPMLLFGLMLIMARTA